MLTYTPSIVSQTVEQNLLSCVSSLNSSLRIAAYLYIRVRTKRISLSISSVENIYHIVITTVQQFFHSLAGFLSTIDFSLISFYFLFFFFLSSSSNSCFSFFIFFFLSFFLSFFLLFLFKFIFLSFSQFFPTSLFIFLILCCIASLYSFTLSPPLSLSLIIFLRYTLYSISFFLGFIDCLSVSSIPHIYLSLSFYPFVSFVLCIETFLFMLQISPLFFYSEKVTKFFSTFLKFNIFSFYYSGFFPFDSFSRAF
ncbi:unnamed protein product [Acanthosepion pharaonis]|uniref:Uncharacterized protein n=1 Tax=Acanthosepion pharaonis TaxID=158019 RepID=A0A812DPX6_ACAPH|nr:unnamed protein product [Sepia pharaonis]